MRLSDFLKQKQSGVVIFSLSFLTASEPYISGVIISNPHILSS